MKTIKNIIKSTLLINFLTILLVGSIIYYMLDANNRERHKSNEELLRKLVQMQHERAELYNDKSYTKGLIHHLKMKGAFHDMDEKDKHVLETLLNQGGKSAFDEYVKINNLKQ